MSKVNDNLAARSISEVQSQAVQASQNQTK